MFVYRLEIDVFFVSSRNWNVLYRLEIDMVVYHLEIDMFLYRLEIDMLLYRL